VVELRDSFDVHLPLPTVWERLRLPGECPPGECRLPGFPAIDGRSGCRAGILTSEPQKRLACTKLDDPCAGTAIVVDVGPATAGGWPTRVSVAQSGFSPPLAELPDFLNAHWRRIVADFRLYLEHGVTTPPSTWRASLGAITRETPTGLAVTVVDPDGFADRCGMREGDLLVTLQDVRILDTAQLWTVLAMLNPGDSTAATWVRDGELHAATGELGPYDMPRRSGADPL